MHEQHYSIPDDGHADYAELARSLESLLSGEPDLVSCAANTTSLVFYSLPDLNWVGFYLLDAASGDLLVGPFQGRPACVRIPLDKGVCGAAASTRQTQRIDDVHVFPGHIACDSASNSELVVPLVAADGSLIGVFDLDSPRHARFDADDQAGLEALAFAFIQSLP